MNPWTEDRIRAEVSWDAFRDGRKLCADGLVSGLKARPELLSATVGGGRRPHRVVVRTGQTLEAQCDCPVNRGSGAICCHAVATLLQALVVPKSGPAEQSPAVNRSERPISRPMTFRLSPDFRKALARGRLNVELEEGGELHEADSAFWDWLGRVSDASHAPKRLALTPANLEGFLRSIDSHPRVFDAQGERIHVETLPPLRLLDSAFRAGGLEFQFETDSYQTIDGIDCLGWSTGHSIGWAPWSPEDEGERLWWQETLRTGRGRIERPEMARRLQALLDLSAEPRPGWLGNLTFETYDSDEFVRLEGSVNQLELEIVQNPGAGLDLDEERGVVRLKKSIQTNDFPRGLTKWGFVNSSVNIWKLVDKDQIYDFLANDLDALKLTCRVELGPRLQHGLQTLHVIRPVIQEVSPGSLSLDLSFQTGSGSVVPRSKVLDWIRSGKKVVKTPSGAEVMLSRQLREEFEHLAADLGIPRPEGRVQLDRARAEVLRGWAGMGQADAPGVELVEPPEGIRLRTYQEEGLRWICSRLLNLGAALLADEMGLGKTLQTLLAIRSLQAAGRCGRALVLVPGSLLSNWEAECARFAPDARVVRMHGEGRDVLRGRPADLVLTSYGTFQRDLAYHLGEDYGLVVLDEASLIRNPDSAISRDVAKLGAPMRLALTGTPMENRLTDLWSVFRFLSPGYLGAKADFRDRYEGELPAAVPRLRARVRPFLLRRTKAEVAKDLPDKVVNDVILELEPTARRLYQEVATAGLLTAEAQKSEGAARMHLLTTLLRLRQICLDPGLFPDSKEEGSVKSDWLKQMLEWKLELAGERPQKCLVFSQFSSYLRRLKEKISESGWRVFLLDGSTRDRGEVVSQFQNADEASVFLISLKAGGYGLNLTAADTVVHMDPWWNPAVEAQATDRAHRIGQTLPVTVYRLFVRDSVEERVRKLQSMKRSLMEGLDGVDPGREWTDGDLADLIR
ncbi:MAG: DEAD/DEAH box helicase [Akkermansiaceae bacterium]|nr:DEAD/DEAH box helicase [Akkermansiaceae bacterium]